METATVLQPEIPGTGEATEVMVVAITETATEVLPGETREMTVQTVTQPEILVVTGEVMEMGEILEDQEVTGEVTVPEVEVTVDQDLEILEEEILVGIREEIRVVQEVLEEIRVDLEDLVEIRVLRGIQDRVHPEIPASIIKR